MPHAPHILIATGGSGGHLFPAFAVADEIKRRWHEATVHLTTTDRPIEREICRSAGRMATVLPLLPAAEARRHPIRFARSVWRAHAAAYELLDLFDPDCVVGTGGLSMAPVIKTAIRANIPVVLLEQNAVPGRGTRWFSRQAAAVCSTCSEMQPPLTNARVELTGNPVRTPIARLVLDDWNPGGPILILGGSQGARALNEALGWIAHHQPALLAEHEVVHQTGGPESARELKNAYRSVGIRASVAPFFDDVASLYAAAGVIIARAGATTLAEVACAGVPAILVPYPQARDRHQHANAQAFASAGAAVVVEQAPTADETGRQLARCLAELLRDEPRRAAMSAAMRRLARPDAARRVVDVLERTIASRT